MDANIVENWLRSLNMVQYTQSFLDNGYDDLEICKQIGPEDLDAIGVLRADHREEVLAAVQHLREHGGTAVYFTLDPEYQRIHGLGPYNNGLGPARGIPYNVQRSLDLDHAVVVRTTNGHGCFLESGACGSSSSGGGDVLTYDTTSPSPNKCPVHSNYVENSILGNVSVCVTNGYSGGGGGGYNPVGNISPGGGAGGDGGSGSQPGTGTITPAWLSPTHRPLTVPIALSNGGGIQGGGLPVSQPQVPLPPPPPPPPPPLGGFPSINSARVGVPLPLPPCQRCLGEDLAQQQQHDFPPCSTCLGASPLSPQQHYLEGKQTLVTFTRLQLTAILRDKLETDCIVLTEEKYLKKSDSHHLLEQLSRQYAEDLNTHTQDVFLRLLEIQELFTNSNGHDSSPERDSENGETEPCRMFSVYGQANRSVPPPLPSCPPPSTLYEDPDCLSVLKRESPSHSSRSPLLPPARQNSEEGPIEYPLGEIDLRKKGLTLGRLFRKKPPKKYVYKQYEGDLNASEITMPDEERIELMLLVKEGKLSMHEAVEKVKRYEKQKRDEFLREKGREGDKRPS